MVTARTAVRGLSPADLDGIRETLAAGRRPKVMFTETAGQVAGQVGQVVQLADPDAGEEFVVVRFGRDELPFSPADLAIPARGTARRADSAGNGRKSAKPAEPAPGPELRLTQPPVPAPRDERPTGPAIRPAAWAHGNQVPAERPDPAAPAPRKAGRAARPKPPATLTVTLAYADGEWMVSATQGAKSLAKPYVIKPADAQRLRSQLAEVEARLAELGELR